MIKLTWENAGVSAFLLFFLLTPLIPKIKIREGILQEGIYLEPLLPFLVLAVLLFLFSFWKGGKTSFLAKARTFLIPHPLAKIFYLLLLVLFLSWVYGVFLTGNTAWGDFLRLIKYGLYFLLFPLAIRSAQVLKERGVKIILLLFFLVGISVSIISLARIYQFVAAGNLIDFWVYSTQSRSVGFLGQYLDLTDFSLDQIPKAAHATFGLYLSVILGAGLVFFSQVKNLVIRAGALLGIGVIFAALLYTLSRGAVATGVLVVLAGLAWLIKTRRFWALGVLAVFLFLESSVLIQLNREVYDKFASTFPASKNVTAKILGITSPVGEGIIRAGQELAQFLGFIEEVPAGVPSIAVVREKEIEPYPGLGVALDASLGERVVIWENTLNLLRSTPQFFIFGVGYSTDNLRYFTGGKVVFTHSLFLDLWVRGGLLSLALILAIWILLFFQAARFLFSQKSFVRAFGFILFGFLVGWFLDNAISGEQFFSDAPMLAFWGTLGLVLALASSQESGVRSKKVLIALTSTQVGGAPQVVYDLLEQVKARRQESGVKEFEFVVAGPRGPFVRRFRDLGYKVYIAPFDKIGIRGFRELYRIVKKENIELINSHGKGAGIYSRLVGSVVGVPVVQTFHGLHYSRKNPFSRSFYLLFEKFLTLVTKFVVSVSPSQEKEGIGLGVFPKRKSRVVVNGIKPVTPVTAVKSVTFRNKMGLKSGDFVVAMVARFDEVKGHERFIKLMPDLVKTVPNLKIVFAGGPTTASGQAKKLARKLRVSGAAVFLGERNDVPQILQAVDASVLPSYHEGLPISVLEASAAGLPVIGSNVVGIKDAVQDEKTGLLVNFDKQAEVVKAFKRLAKSPALRKRMGEQGRRFVGEHFSMEEFVDGTLAVYNEALE